MSRVRRPALLDVTGVAEGITVKLRLRLRVPVLAPALLKSFLSFEDSLREIVPSYPGCGVAATRRPC